MATSKHSLQREKLVKATQKIARTHGLQSTNLRLVAEEAGVSPASVLYYFDSKEMLFQSAISSILDEFYNDRVQLLSSIESSEERLVAMIYAGIPDEVNEDMRVLLEITSMLPRMPQLQPFVSSIVEKQLNLYFTVIEVGTGMGIFSPSPNSMTVARNILALEDAYDIYPLTGLQQNRQDIRDGVISYAELALNVDLSTVPRPSLR